MLSGTNIIYSALLTVFYLKKKLYRQHLLGVILILLGVLLVGLACYWYHRHGEDP
jgi:drug/metabolite transporter (DMT)-like permease